MSDSYYSSQMMLFTRQQGKEEYYKHYLNKAMDDGRSVVFLTGDQRAIIELLRKLFPDCLFSVVGKDRVKIHRKKSKCLG